jgi:MSHA pilin protein MshA
LSFSSKIGFEAFLTSPYFHIWWCHAPKVGAWRFILMRRAGNQRALILKKPKGFTLIELIIVIVIIGILAAIAVPKYVDMSTKAQVAVVNGLTGALRAAAAIAYADRVVSSSDTTVINATTILNTTYMSDTGGAVATATNVVTATVSGITYTWSFTNPSQVSTHIP